MSVDHGLLHLYVYVVFLMASYRLSRSPTVLNILYGSDNDPATDADPATHSFMLAVDTDSWVICFKGLSKLPHYCGRYCSNVD